MNFKAIIDGECSTVTVTEEPADGLEVFATLTEAKRAVDKSLASRILGLRLARRHVRGLCKRDLPEDS